MTAANALPADAIVRRLPPPPRPAESAPLPAGKPAILRFTETAEDDWTEQRSVIFDVEDKDGNVTEYTVLDNPTPDMALEWLDLTRRQGVLVATSWALETMLGPEGHAALRGYKRLKRKDLADIVKAITGKLVDVLNDPKDWA